MTGTASRRGLLAALPVSLLPAAAVPDALAPSGTGGAVSAAEEAGPDDELIAACAAYAEAIERYEVEGGSLEYSVCPLCASIKAARARAEAAPPAQTLAGLRAVAELCRTMAAENDDGSRDYSESFCGTWPDDVIEGLLRLVAPGGAA